MERVESSKKSTDRRKFKVMWRDLWSGDTVVYSSHKNIDLALKNSDKLNGRANIVDEVFFVRRPSGKTVI